MFYRLGKVDMKGQMCWEYPGAHQVDSKGLADIHKRTTQISKIWNKGHHDVVKRVAAANLRMGSPCVNP
jgi:hypothetical protein